MDFQEFYSLNYVADILDIIITYETAFNTQLSETVIQGMDELDLDIDSSDSEENDNDIDMMSEMSITSSSSAVSETSSTTSTSFSHMSTSSASRTRTHSSSSTSSFDNSSVGSTDENLFDVVGIEMAEALMEESLPTPETKFFCHKCSVEIPRVLPNYTCPTCNSGFIEQIEPAQEEEDDDDDDISVEENMAPSAHDFVSLMMGDLVGDAQRASGDETGPRYMTRSQRGNGQNMPIENLIQEFIVNITGLDWNWGGGEGGGRRVGPVSFFLGNPGDYVWGREGLDAIVTQLINQMDGTGPPPLAKEKIQTIPIVQIIDEQVAQNLQCSVCWEDFQKGENVRKLPCEHVYHENCIIPWLELHGTCPICRKVLYEDSNDDSSRSSSGASSSGLPTGIPHSLASLFRAAAREGRDSNQELADLINSGSSSTRTRPRSSSSPSSSNRPNTRSRSQRRNDNNFWDMDQDFD